MKKTLLFYPAIFIATALLCMAFLMLTALIPRERIRENATTSADFFMETDLFEHSVGKLENFKKDNYADCITTGIAWHLGEGNLYEAVIAANYNRSADENVNVSFYNEMQGKESQTESYCRYWHGSAGVVRLLLLISDVETIRYILVTLGAILNAAFVFTLIRKKQVALGLTYVFAFILVNGFFALTCLEYAFVFLLAPISAIVLLTGRQMKQKRYAVAVFLVVGMLTAFFDFLTAETLTYTIPFMVYYVGVWESKKTKDKKSAQTDWNLFLQTGCAWCAGYAGMFLLKWLLAWITLGKEAFLSATEMAMERIGGDVGLTANIAGEKATLLQRWQGIWQRNAGCLYWGSQDMTPATLVVITALIVAVLGIFWYMAHKEKFAYDKTKILLAVACIPYIRFFILSNHSYIHYFFTYRAQMVSVIIVLFLIYKTTILSERVKGKSR